MFFMVGVCREYKGSPNILGFRLYNTDTMEYKDKSVEDVCKDIEEGHLKVVNITVKNNKVNKISNKLSYYPDIVDGVTVDINKITVIGKYGDEFVCVDSRGIVEKFTLEELVNGSRYELTNVVIRRCTETFNNKCPIPTIDEYKHNRYINKSYINKCKMLDIAQLILRNTDDGIKVVGVDKSSMDREVIIVPSFVTAIDDAAFCNCYNLRDIKFVSGLKSIGRGVFYECGEINRIVIPDTVEYIGDRAFEACFNLRDIEIPDSVKYLGKRAFRSCFELRNVKLSSNIKQIREAMFLDCEGIKSISIPQGIEYIEKEAFQGCMYIEKVNLPDSLKGIGNEAFSFCSSLKRIHIPRSVEELGERVFYSNTQLKEIIIDNKNIKTHKNTFEWCGVTNQMVRDGEK